MTLDLQRVADPSAPTGRSRLELLYNIGRELSSRLDLADLLRRILVHTTENTGVPSGSIIALDENGDVMDAALFYDGRIHDKVGEQLTSIKEHGLAGWVIRNAQPALIPNTLLDPRWMLRESERAADAAKSAIAVPLRSRDRVVGALTLVQNRPDYFRDEDLSLVTAIADQAAIAVENARLFEERKRSENALAEEKRRLELLYELSQDLTSTLNPREVAKRALDRICQAFDYAALRSGAFKGTLMVSDPSGAAQEAPPAQEDSASTTAQGLRLLMVSGIDASRVEEFDRQIQLRTGRGVAGRVAAQRTVVIVPDVSQPALGGLPGDPDAVAQTIPGLDDWVRSTIGIPLLAGDALIGVLNLHSDRPDAFRPDQVPFLAAAATSIAVALANARLFEAEQRRRQIASTLQEVARIINATLDPNQVFPLVLEQLARLIRYDSSAVLLRDGERLRVVAARGFRDLHAVLAVSVSVQRGVSAGVMRERRPVAIADAQKAADWDRSGPPELSAIHGWIGAPLIVKDEVLGLITVDSARAGEYTDADARLVGAFADQVATAVVNARLYADSQRQMRANAALAETARAITSTLDLDEVLRRLLNRTVSMLQVEAGSIGLVDGARKTLEFKVAEGPGAQAITGLTLKLGQGIAGWVAQHGRPVLVPDARGDPRFFAGVDKQTGFVTRSIACVPIVVQDKVLGIIELLNPTQGTFDRESLQLLSNLAALAGSAIWHAQLFQETQVAEQRYASLFEDSIDPIIITDSEGLITEANYKACQFVGYEREEMIGLRIDRIHRLGTGLLGEERFRHVQSGAEMSFETKAMTRAGREVWVEVHAKRIQRGGQELIQWIEHDISERMGLEEMRNDLTSMIFHDLRSPLGNIISSLDVLRVSLPGDDEALQSVLAIAARSSQRLSRLVDSLLDLRRLEAGQAILQRAPASLNALVAEAAEQIHPIAESKGISLRFDLPPQLPSVNMDADMIRRVIINLIENGVKYTQGEGLITVSVRAVDPSTIAPTSPVKTKDEGGRMKDESLDPSSFILPPSPFDERGQVTVSIRDTGPGIPEGEQQRIFEKYARVQRQGAPKGLGLGLAFCKLAVEAHGGRIWVESKPGQGATFNFTLPVE